MLAQRRRRWGNNKTELAQCGTDQLNIVVSMLGQRRRRWTNIEPIMAKCLVFAGSWMIVQNGFS